MPDMFGWSPVAVPSTDAVVETPVADAAVVETPVTAPAVVETPVAPAPALADYLASPVDTTVVETPVVETTVATPAVVAAPVAPTVVDVPTSVQGLDDLNNGTKTLEDFVESELISLNKFANDHPELPLGGYIRSSLSKFVESN